MEPSQKPAPPPATGDPVATVLSKMPTEKGDISTFLISYGAGYLIVDTVAAGMGLPPPVTTAALVSTAAVGVKNAVQGYLARRSVPPLTEALDARTAAFKELLAEDNRFIAHELYERLTSAERLWHRGIDTDDDYKMTLDQLVAEYKAAPDTPMLGGKT
jgi:hypothetical protein